MKTITTSQLNDKIKDLPYEFLIKIDDYIDDLLSQNNIKDWAVELSESHKNLINRGNKDIEANNFFTNQEVKEKIKNYIQLKK